MFDRDIVLYTLLPHAHLRGRAAKFTADYPDGRKEMLLSVPKYDFNWQTTYALNPPKPHSRRHAHRARHDLGQFRAESGQPGPESRRALGRADLGRDERRLDALSICRGRCQRRQDRSILGSRRKVRQCNEPGDTLYRHGRRA